MMNVMIRSVVGALCLIASPALAQPARPVPFATVDLSAPSEIEPITTDSAEYARIVASNPGLWAPAIVSTGGSKLRGLGASTEADALELLGDLRLSTMLAVCRTGAERPDDAAYIFRRSLGELVYFERRGRAAAFVTAAARRALDLDEKTLWAFTPWEGWCRSAFNVEGGKRIVPKDVAAFWAEHDKMRTILMSLATVFESAASVAIQEGLPPFALGAPAKGRDVDALRFLSIMRPTKTLRPDTDRDGLGEFRGVSPNGATAVFKGGDLRLRSLKRGAADARVPVQSSGFAQVRFLPGSDVVLEYLAPELCSGVGEDCGRTPTISFSRTNVRSGEVRTTRLEVEALSNTLSWNGVAVGASEDRRYVLVKASAWPKPVLVPGVPTSIVSKQALVVLDTERSEIVAVVSDDEAPALFPESFPGVFLAGNTLAELAIVSSSGRQESASGPLVEVVMTRFALSDRRLSRSVQPLASNVDSASVARNLVQGQDIAPALQGCRALAPAGYCKIIGITPDKKYWLIAETQYEQEGRVALVDASSGALAGALTIFDDGALPITGPAYAADAGALLLMFGSEAEAYIYQPPGR